MIHRTSKEKIDEYYASQYLNQSAIKVLLSEGIESFSEKFNQIVSTSDLYYEEKEHFLIGSAVDDRLTMGREYFTNKYHISNLLNKPGEKAMSVIKKVFDDVMVMEATQIDEGELVIDRVSSISIYQEAILAACEEHAFYPKWKPETKIASIVKNGTEYWEDLKKANGKQILSDLEGSISSAIIEAYLNHINTRRYFTDSPTVDIIYQLPIYFIYKGVECKALIDKIVIDHIKKTIKIFDIKTTGRQLSKFANEVKFRRYDIQGSFYKYGLEYVQASKFPILDRLTNKNLRGYEIVGFACLTQSTVKPGYPIVFPLSNKLLELARVGNPEADDSTKNGWDYAIELYKKWLDYGLSVERRIDELNGIVHINSNFEYDDMVIK